MKKIIKKIVCYVLLMIVLLSECKVSVWAYDAAYPLPTLTNNQAQDIANIATSQLGYSGANGTIYGSWWNNVTNWGQDYTYSAWCAMFACWCAEKAGAGLNVAYDKFSAYTPNFLDFYKSRGQADISFQSVPKVGDFIFFGTRSGKPGHVAIVTGYDSASNTVTFVGGNQTNAKGGYVTKSSCKWASGTLWGEQYVIGYGRPDYSGTGGGTIVNPPGSISTPINPEGCLDSVTGGNGTITVSGWAFDRNAVNTALEIHVYVGGTYSDGHAIFGTQIKADKYRPDVNNVHGTGEYHGFSETISVPATGTYPVYVYAINVGGKVGSNYNTLLGSETVTISSEEKKKPTISGANSPGTITVGSVFSISGTVNSGSAITNVTAGCYDVNGNMKTGKSTSPNATSYNLKGLDPYVYFNHLTPGVYYYRVQATNLAGTETLVNKSFIVLANSATILDGTYMIQPEYDDNYVLDIADHSDANEANVQLATVSNNAYQRYKVSYVGDGYYTLMNSGSGKFLDVKGAGTTSGTNVQQYERNGGTAQNWQILPNGNGYCLVPQCATSLCLDIENGSMVSGTNVRLYDPNLTDAQRFEIVASELPVISGVQVDMDASGYTISCDLSEEFEIDRVQFPTWTVENGNDDLIGASDGSWKTNEFYSGTISGNKVTYRVNISDYNYQVGMYRTHIYVYDIAGNSSMFEVWDVEFSDTEAPSLTNPRVAEITKEGFVVECDVTDNIAVSKVTFIIGDFIAYDAVVENNVASCFIPFSDHDYKMECSYMFIPIAEDIYGNWEAYDSPYLFVGSYVKTYTITYHLNGGVNDPYNPESYSEEYPYVELRNPVKDGYSFVGWYTAQNGGERITAGTMLEGNLDLYAIWTKEETGGPDISDDLPMVVELGTYHSAVITEAGNLWMWGNNTYGQLGDGTLENRSTPVKVMEDVKSVDIEGNFSAAIKKDGSLWTWGWNQSKQLGDGTAEDRSTPVKIMDNVNAVVLGESYGAAVKEDGSLWMWGNNRYGQLGDGTTEDKSTPVKIMDNVKSVALGCAHTAVIKNDGSLWMWGSNLNGELGDGTTENRSVPFKVMDQVKSVELGVFYTAVIKNDGSLWIWGANDYGQMGDGTEWSKSDPVKIMDNVKSVTLGEYHSAAIKEDGSLWTWGGNIHGEIGNGKDIWTVLTPVKIMDTVKDISLGGYHSAAIKEDGSLWTWGWNNYGQLGVETDGDYFSPVDISYHFPAIALNRLPFEDITKGDWFYDAVSYNYITKTMTGKSATIFAPYESLARGQFASILYRINGEPPVEFETAFPDVPADIWYTNPILWAKSAGVVNGYSDGRFGPGDNITREQMAIMMFNYANYRGYDTSTRGNLGKFTDVELMSWYASVATQWAVGSGIISGKENGTVLDPQGNTSRAECAIIIRNFMEKYEK